MGLSESRSNDEGHLPKLTISFLPGKGDALSVLALCPSKFCLGWPQRMIWLCGLALMNYVLVVLLGLFEVGGFVRLASFVNTVAGVMGMQLCDADCDV